MLEVTTSCSWPIDGLPLTGLGIRVHDLAARLGFALRTWYVDGLGPARGFDVSLPSGRVYLFEELAYSVRYHGARGPVIYVSAAELVALGAEFLVDEIVTALKVSRSDVTSIADSSAEHHAAELAAQAAVAGPIQKVVRVSPGFSTGFPKGDCYKVTLRGRVPKLVRCEQCSQEYVYYLERSAAGEGFSLLCLDTEGAKRRAEKEAREQLRDSLQKDCDPVPCPACGHVQEHMIGRARQLRLRWMGTAALYLVPTSILLLVAALIATMDSQQGGALSLSLVAVVLWVLAGAAGLGVLVLPLWKFFSNRRYNPNTQDVEVRKQMGQERTTWRKGGI